MTDFDSFFGKPIKEQKRQSTIKYLNFKHPITYSFQFIEPLTPTYIHYLVHQRVSVHCLGEACPICRQNESLLVSYGKEATKQSGFNYRQLRYVANVLDYTPVVTCPNCESKNFYVHVMKSNTCSNCSQPIPPDTPLDKPSIKLASLSSTFIEVFKVMAASMLDENGNVLPPTSYIVNALVTIVGGKKQIVPSIGKVVSLPNINNEDKFPVEGIALRFSAEELTELLKGVPFRDIITARNETSVNATTPPEVDSQAVQKEVDDVTNQILDKFFN